MSGVGIGATSRSTSIGGDFSQFGPVFAAFGATHDWGQAIRSVIGSDTPAGLVVVRIDKDGRLRADTGPARADTGPAIAGHSVPIDVVVDSAVYADLSVTLAGRDVRVASRGAAIETIDID
jgi:hypothetical protein